MSPEHSRPTAEAGAFEGIEGRSSADYVLRNTQQQLVALGGQADFKASVMITASAIVSSVAASQLGDTTVRWAAVVLMSFLVLALLASVLAVFPKFTTHPEPGERLPPGFNPLFFGHYARVPKDRYLDEVAAMLRDDGAIYRSIAADLYDQGVYLVQAKYRYLRARCSSSGLLEPRSPSSRRRSSISRPSSSCCGRCGRRARPSRPS